MRSQRRRLILAEVASWPEWKRQLFERLRNDGSTITMAHILASRQMATIRTDDVFISQQRQRVQDMPQWQREQLAKDYRERSGYSLKPTDTVMLGMCRYPGDMDGVINHAEGGLSKIKRIARERKQDIRGFVDIDGADNSEPPSPNRVHKLHPRIVKDIRTRMIEEDPGLACKDQRELSEQIVETHSPKE